MTIGRFYHSARISLMFSSNDRARYIRKHNLFGSIGEHVRVSQMLLPLYSDRIFIGNNVEIASGVRFVIHDAIHTVFKYSEDGNDEKHDYPEHIGDIRIGNNVFIGAGVIIIAPVEIGDNCIVAAGAVVNKDVASGSVVGGVPAKTIGSYDELKKKRMQV